MYFNNSRNVLLCVTFSESSMDWASHAAKTVFVGDRITFAHVLTPLPPTTPGVIWNNITNETRIGHAGSHLRQELTARGVVDPHMVVVVGSPAASVCEAAGREQSDLIVAAKSRKSSVQRLVLGSVCDEITRRAACPVLICQLANSDHEHVPPDAPMATPLNARQPENAVA